VSLPRYKDYIQTGIEWLGELPAHWSTKPLWTLFRRIKRTGYETEQLLSVYREFGVIPKASRDDNNNQASEDLVPYQLVLPGDLAINKMKAWQGSVGLSEHRGIVSPAYFVYETINQEDRRYLHYLMRSHRYITAYLSMSKGIRVNQWDLEPQLHSRLPIVLPPRQEQTAIATFLDRETTKIDSLLAQQQLLIDLLKEKRQAIISQAVAKGLNADAPMKRSGVAWMCEIPRHWKVRRVKDVSDFITSGPRGWSEQVTEVGNIFVQSGDLNDLLQVDFDGAKRVLVGDDAEASRTRLNNGDVVVCITGAKTGNVAVCAVVPETAYINQHLCLIRPNSAVLPAFLGALLKSKIGQTHFELSQYGLKQGLSLENIKNALVFLPPIAEQAAIVSFLNLETAKFRALTAEAENAIALLKERRTCVISAAVTGEIDIRDLAASQPMADVAA
jgi:type I restriction enzyme S subunit